MIALDDMAELPGAESVDQIRKKSATAEASGQLHPEQLSLLYRQGWFKMFVPREYGGLGLTVPEGVKIEEALSRADGSVGWVVTLCSGAAWFAGFLPAAVLTKVFKNDLLCVAGSGAVTGTAHRVGDGYEVQGYWRYASGALHATAFTANCALIEGDQFLVDETGKKIVRAFLFEREEVIVHRRWNAIGMVATGSHDIEVKPLRVDARRCFHIDPARAARKEALYQYPFQQLAEVTLAVNLSGMAIRFMELCDLRFAESRDRFMKTQATPPDERLEAARQALAGHRRIFYRTLDESWNACTGGNISTQLLENVAASSRRLAQASRTLVDELYPLCGIPAANPTEEINRVWRNFHTATQHPLLH
jgi:alkylation response protein AidB-like acyl-CoA dehydrogenase